MVANSIPSYRRITLLCECLIYAIMRFFFTNAAQRSMQSISGCGAACGQLILDLVLETSSVLAIARAVPLFKYYGIKEGSHALYLLLNRYTVTNRVSYRGIPGRGAPGFPPPPPQLEFPPPPPPPEIVTILYDYNDM